MKLFIVGQVFPGTDRQWEFQGVFSTYEAAKEACKKETFFIGPAVLDEPLPAESMPWWPEAHYPLTKTAG